jgi:excinuclease ABC subunit B
VFQLTAPYEPTGDQPTAISQLTAGLKRGDKWQTLLGVTGSGKTFTMANVIAAVDRPTLVLVHNKTLAAQLWAEFKEYFPNHAVHYFVSYYDYYQPEAYIQASDTYIEKDADINDEIERLRLAATQALLTRRDVIIVATVSCIYGLGSPELYKSQELRLEAGQTVSRTDLLRRLTEMFYQRNDLDFRRGCFRVQGEVIDIFPAYDEEYLRFTFDYDTLNQITRRDPVTNEIKATLDVGLVFPAKHYVTDPALVQEALAAIQKDLTKEVADFKAADKLLEAQRLKQRTEFDLEMIRNVGSVKGIENYSRYFDGRKPGSPPHVLIDYFPQDFLLFVDESHITIPQIGAMYAGDRARKDNLINFGFRLSGSRDNRPLTFEEFSARIGQVVAVSATPSQYELERSTQVVEQLIRPTGLLDPVVTIRPIEGQVQDLIKEVRARTAQGQRVLVTTLTKRMAEDLTEYLLEQDIKVHYLHSDVATIERSEILRDLRLGKYDVLVGINLLREGLDLPEVSLVAILDADKEGFLRSRTSLIQTIGRAARHVDGQVIMYANKLTDSIKIAVAETNRRRQKQTEYNEAHDITPESIQKEIKEVSLLHKAAGREDPAELAARLTPRQKQALITELRRQMEQCALELNFEEATKLRDKIQELQKPTG